MSFSDNIKAIRKKSFLTQEEFSKIIGVTLITVNRWESGKTKPNLMAMKSIKNYCIANSIPYADLEKEWLGEK